MTNTTDDKVVKQIIDVTLRSVKAQEINILELGNLNDLIPREAAEKIRKEFVKFNTPIKQLTNLRKFVDWTTNTGITQNLLVKYVPDTTYRIENEMLIFDDTVAIYRLNPSPFYVEITDSSFANTMRSIFRNLWQLGDSLLLAADGSSQTKQYLPITHKHDNIPVVIYPAKDDGVLERAFPRDALGSIQNYVDDVIGREKAFYKDADMIIAYVWNQESVRYCDIWKVSRNSISDDAGFLYDVRIYKELEAVSDVGVASGNSSIVITAEEMLLRELVINEGLSFAEASDRKKYQARFPIGFVPAEDFYRA